MATDSVEKLVEVVECARACGVHVGPIRVEKEHASPQTESSAVAIFPLYSWYHSGWDAEPDLINEMYLAVEEAMPFQKKWGDFSMCSWPAELSLSQADWATTSRDPDCTVLAESFASINEKFLVPPPAMALGEESAATAAAAAAASEAAAGQAQAPPRRGVCSHPSVL